MSVPTIVNFKALSFSLIFLVWLDPFGCIHFFVTFSAIFPPSFLGEAEIWTHVQGPWLRSWVLDVQH